MKDWTIMVYMAGDNNLSEEMVTALTGMKNAMGLADSDKKLNLVAIYDSAYPTAPTAHYNFTKENSGKLLTECIIEYVHTGKKGKASQQNNESPQIIDFVNWATTNWKARNYGLILSGHSDGVIGRTMFKDYNPSTALNLAYLKNILLKAKKHLGKDKKFAFLGFDSCLMNMAEVGFELSDVADVLVASQGNVPASGWAYENIFTKIIKEVNSTRGLSSETFAKSVVNEFVEFSKDYNVGGRSVNISACDLTKAKDLRKSINSLAAAFNEILTAPIEISDETDKRTAQENALLIERLKSLIHKSHYYSQTFMYEQAVDVADFANSLASNCELSKKEIEFLCGRRPDTHVADVMYRKLDNIRKKSVKVCEAVERYIFAHGMCGAEYQFSSGVSIFFPWTLLSLFMIYGRYRNLKFSKNSPWFDFLERYTEMTYRATDEPKYHRNLDYLQWRNDVAHLQHKDVSAKDVSAKDVSAKDVSAKIDNDDFYKFFRRFRNHPIYHEIVVKKINDIPAPK